MTIITCEQFEAGNRAAAMGAREPLREALTAMGITIAPPQPSPEMVTLAEQLAYETGDNEQDAAGGVALRNIALPIIDAQAARIAELEAELSEQARINGMGGEREAGHLARIAGLEAALRAIADPKALRSYGDPTVLRDYARNFLNGGNHE